MREVVIGGVSCPANRVPVGMDEAVSQRLQAHAPGELFLAEAKEGLGGRDTGHDPPLCATGQ